MTAPDGAVLREALEEGRPHSETLLPGVERLLARAGLGRGDVEAIAVGTGPGSFTGLRVGLATFKAWASVSGLPLVPVVSLDAVAIPLLREGDPVVILADARKGEVYAACYLNMDAIGLPVREDEVALIPHERVPAWVSSRPVIGGRAAGTAVAMLEGEGLLGGLDPFTGCSGVPDASEVLALGRLLLDLGKTVEPSGLVPCYVRPPDARKPSPGTVITPGPDDGGRQGAP